MRGPQPGDEVAATGPTGLFQSTENGVNRGKPSRDPFGRDSLSGQHAVSFEERQREGMSPFGASDRRSLAVDRDQ